MEATLTASMSGWHIMFAATMVGFGLGFGMPAGRATYDFLHILYDYAFDAGAAAIGRRRRARP